MNPIFLWSKVSEYLYNEKIITIMARAVDVAVSRILTFAIDPLSKYILIYSTSYSNLLEKFYYNKFSNIKKVKI